MLIFRPDRLLAVTATVARRLGARLWPVDTAKVSNRLLACLVLAGLGYACIASAVGMIRGINSFPELSSWRKFPARFEEFLNEHLPGRVSILDANAKLRVETLGISSAPRVWLGTGGMLFFDPRPELAAEFIGEQAEASAVEYWSELARKRQDWCTSRGIRFLTVIAPDKQSVCTDHLPPALRDLHGASILDRIMSAWQREPAVPVVDLRADLRSARLTTEVYLQKDTHWSPYGTWLAYRETVSAMKALVPTDPPADWNELELERSPTGSGDIWRLLGFSRPAAEEWHDCPRLHDRIARIVPERVEIPENQRLSHRQAQVWTRRDGRGPRVILFGDSFAGNLYQFLLAQNCSRLVSAPTYEMIELLIERERPDIVICETVERKLQHVRPDMPSVP